MATETPTPKKQKKTIFRKANDMDDARLCEKSRVWQSLLLDHLPAFTAFDAKFDMAYANTWMAKIEEFEAFPSDEHLRADMDGKNRAIQEKTKTLRTTVDDVEYYAVRAFPGEENKRTLEEFGFERLRKMISRGEARWLVPSFANRKVMDDYMTQLTNAGMPAAIVTAFELALNQLGEAEVDQEYGLRLRLRATTQRIKLFNHLFDIHIEVKKAAAIIFRDKPKVAAQFE